MSLTVEEIVEETRRWTPEQVGELMGRLAGDLHTSDPDCNAAWKAEISRRVKEIESGQAVGIPAEEVLAKGRAILRK